jgi:Spy/CpxP family protein refolding chaperone
VLKIDIKAKLWEDTIDKKGINKLIDKKYEIKKEKAKALVDTYAQFNNILTEEQKKTLETIIRQRHKK